MGSSSSGLNPTPILLIYFGEQIILKCNEKLKCTVIYYFYNIYILYIFPLALPRLTYEKTVSCLGLLQEESQEWYVSRWQLIFTETSFSDHLPPSPPTRISKKQEWKSQEFLQILAASVDLVKVHHRVSLIQRGRKEPDSTPLDEESCCLIL